MVLSLFVCTFAGLVLALCRLRHVRSSTGRYVYRFALCGCPSNYFPRQSSEDPNDVRCDGLHVCASETSLDRYFSPAFASASEFSSQHSFSPCSVRPGIHQGAPRISRALPCNGPEPRTMHRLQLLLFPFPVNSPVASGCRYFGIFFSTFFLRPSSLQPAQRFSFLRRYLHTPFSSTLRFLDDALGPPPSSTVPLTLSRPYK